MAPQKSKSHLSIKDNFLNPALNQDYIYIYIYFGNPKPAYALFLISRRKFGQIEHTFAC